MTFRDLRRELDRLDEGSLDRLVVILASDTGTPSPVAGLRMLAELPDDLRLPLMETLPDDQALLMAVHML